MKKIGVDCKMPLEYKYLLTRYGLCHVTYCHVIQKEPKGVQLFNNNFTN